MARGDGRAGSGSGSRSGAYHALACWSRSHDFRLRGLSDVPYADTQGPVGRSFATFRPISTMLPWPVNVSQLYPLPRGRHPTRPWWRYVRDLHVWRRHDGRSLEAGPDGSFLDKEVLLALMTEVDRTAPLPFPGWRAGQIWAVVVETRMRVVFIQGHNPKQSRPWVIDGRPLEQEKLERLLQQALLVSDLACPWVAPWAPRSTS